MIPVYNIWHGKTINILNLEQYSHLELSNLYICMLSYIHVFACQRWIKELIFDLMRIKSLCHAPAWHPTCACVFSWCVWCCGVWQLSSSDTLQSRLDTSEARFRHAEAEHNVDLESALIKLEEEQQRCLPTSHGLLKLSVTWLEAYALVYLKLICNHVMEMKPRLVKYNKTGDMVWFMQELQPGPCQHHAAWAAGPGHCCQPGPDRRHPQADPGLAEGTWGAGGQGGRMEGGGTGKWKDAMQCKAL